MLPLLLLAAAAAPCTTTTCSEWISMGMGKSRSLIYRSHPLEKKNTAITRATIVIHGQGRNADDYFRTGVAAAFLAGALDDTIVISPRFASNDGNCKDKLDAGEVNWKCSGNSWRSGATALGRADLTSYDFVDEVLRKLANKKMFPNLKTIVVSGHSAGGQYVARYAMSSKLHETLGVKVTYVVSNPSSYAYLDDIRPAEHGGCDATYDQWPYGMNNRQGYAATLTTGTMKDQYVSRPVSYLLGELDTLPLAGFDSSCAAMAQGPNRLERGKAYAETMTNKYGARQHTVTTIPLCGHNARCMFTADAALKILFPK
jgi:pimeloyl-ACP methyl ester carboxylesterase